jgi:hypothetical protein
MDAGLLDVLHDAGDEDVLVLVGQRVDIDLDGVAQVGIDSTGFAQTFTASRV